MLQFKNTFSKWLALVSLPFLLIVGVNTCNGPSIHAYQAAQCTRYCHDNGCPHALQKYETGQELARMARQAYAWNIRALHQNPFGLSYQEVNLLVYVLLFPTLMAALLWGALKKW